MRIVAWVHLYPPDHCAGAELMLHEILLSLQAAGHSVSVICDSTSAGFYDTVPVHAAGTAGAERAKDEADVVITHLDRTGQVVRAVGGRKPIVHLIHNDRQLRFHRVRPDGCQLAVMNSAWIKAATKWPAAQTVVYPPVDPARYRTKPGTAVTLINLNSEKGANVFWNLAERLPEVEFLGVIGGYGQQVIPTHIPANVTIHPHTADIREVYARTRVLLMPSAYESWGRVGVEAAASGIPTIANPTPGLLESLTYSGTFVRLDDLDGWAAAVESLTAPAVYKAKSALALLRSKELAGIHAQQLAALETELVRIVEGWER